MLRLLQLAEAKPAPRPQQSPHGEGPSTHRGLDALPKRPPHSPAIAAWLPRLPLSLVHTFLIQPIRPSSPTSQRATRRTAVWSFCQCVCLQGKGGLQTSNEATFPAPRHSGLVGQVEWQADSWAQSRRHPLLRFVLFCLKSGPPVRPGRLGGQGSRSTANPGGWAAWLPGEGVLVWGPRETTKRGNATNDTLTRVEGGVESVSIQRRAERRNSACGSALSTS